MPATNASPILRDVTTPVMAGVLSLLLAATAVAWNPASFANDGTVEFLTVAPDEGEHWSTVWFVVIDDAVYFRLGPRAATRVDKHTGAPAMKMRDASGNVHEMRYEKAPDMFEKVADAMANKYWTDIFGQPFRKLGLTSPTMTLRLVPAAATTNHPSGSRPTP